MNNVYKYFSLKDEVVIITGAAGLLGKPHAEAILDMGGIAVLIDINKEKLDNLFNNLMKTYDKNRIFPLNIDVTNELEIETAKLEILDRFGKIDVLINNAANNPHMKSNEKDFRFENLSPDLWNRDIDVGLKGCFYCSKIFGTVMSKQKKGVILNISSDLGIIAPDQRLYLNKSLCENEQPVKPVTYSVVKTGIIGLTRYLSTYWANKNVRTNAVAFGGVFNNQSEDFLEKIEQKIPLGRLANKDEYKGTIIYLCSNASSYMNGSTVVIDGGRTIW